MTILYLSEIKLIHEYLHKVTFCFTAIKFYLRSVVQERKGLKTFIFETPNFSKRNEFHLTCMSHSQLG